VIYSLAINPAGHIFAATGAGIYYTENSGLTWIQTNFTNPTESIAIKSNGYIFAADVSGSVYRSTDNGVSWTNIPNGLSTATIILLAINHNGDVFAASFFGLYKTENDGNSWTHLIPINGMIHSLVINSIDHIFVGFDGGVSRSVNNGTNWEEINAGLTNPHVRSLGINIDGIIFAGTYDGGIFRSIESTTAIEDYNHEIVPTFVLEQNYPNPFNPVTNIGFRIADRGFVSLKVYDVTGREIVTLVAENLIPGDYQYRWDAEKFASGLYFYKITAGSFTKTRKMILIK
jgi:ligand-binding sensor domain-containing protein